MTDFSNPKIVRDHHRPHFPKRAVVTAGMPYGSKDLHFGHVGGVFVHADAFARFLRDRIGSENVLFVSGTDCYGSPIVEAHRQLGASGDFAGGLEDFARYNYERQRQTLDKYHIHPDLFAASGLDRCAEIHREIGALFLKTLHAHGHLEKRATPQFYDAECQTFLNGRQVLGRCPIQGCRAETAYADECALGHQFAPEDLIAPRSALTGAQPEMWDVTNWYLRLAQFRPVLESWLERLKKAGNWRPFVVSTITEQFEPPTMHITRDQMESLATIADQLPPHDQREGRAKSVQLIFSRLEDMEAAKHILGARAIRYRTGKTLVPFRLTGDLEWGLAAPDLDGLTGQTFWVWPESLWAPISFTAAHLEAQGGKTDDWRRWWCARDAAVYQFIGEDNIFFYGLPEMALFLGMQGEKPVLDPPDGQLQLPHLIANRHLLFLDRKASSSGAVKPPLARDLLDFYTADQLRAHFLSLALGLRSTGFRPKPLNPQAGEKEGDPVLKEGNLLSNAFNKAVRSCFYTAQKFCDGKVPVGDIGAGVLELSERTILDFEQAMFNCEFHQTLEIVGAYIRQINQRWAHSKPYSETCDPTLRQAPESSLWGMVSGRAPGDSQPQAVGAESGLGRPGLTKRMEGPAPGTVHRPADLLEKRQVAPQVKEDHP